MIASNIIERAIAANITERAMGSWRGNLQFKKNKGNFSLTHVTRRARGSAPRYPEGWGLRTM